MRFWARIVMLGLEQLPAVFDNLDIQNPKRNSRANSGWEGYFPYYAGFPESFAAAMLCSSDLPLTAKIFDPWNGSGTTTYAASRLGFAAVGHDINPVMVVIARARLLASSEADSLEPLASEILKSAIGKLKKAEIDNSDPLLSWYAPKSAVFLRTLEREVRSHLVGELSLPPDGKLDRISGISISGV
ncbi:hypothetical protein J2R96_003995 [Bradyrhizobium elkanii]|nr:hypothetical protein [Bradyrhizobium elkanii]